MVEVLTGDKGGESHLSAVTEEQKKKKALCMISGKSISV